MVPPALQNGVSSSVGILAPSIEIDGSSRQELLPALVCGKPLHAGLLQHGGHQWSFRNLAGGSTSRWHWHSLGSE